MVVPPGCLVAAVAAVRTEPDVMYSPAQMANMLEGGGKTPILSSRELQDMGFKLVRTVGSKRCEWPRMFARD
jgi:hypothetical protein